MKKIATTRSIAAPVNRVFDTVAHVENFSKAVPHIVKVEFIGDQRSGVGTRFRETRLINGRESAATLEVTEYTADQKIRIVSDEGGTVWDTVFTTTPTADSTTLSMEMEARPHTLLARVMTPLIMNFIGKAIESDMDAVKTFCEAESI